MPDEGPTPPEPREVDLDALFQGTYQELRRLAAVVGRGDPSETLNPTALVNEAYLRLAESLRVSPASTMHFKRIAARAMRQVLVDAARRRRALKRGGDAVMVTFDAALDGVRVARSEEVLALDEALAGLAALEPRQAQIVEFRFFGGYSLDETARLLGVSPATVQRDWRAARAWLLLELGRPG
ncbi:hypothetical protein AWN76_003535 [Rhodothermaceae bacterium RA]|nr:hypothetical protein AWN76_003535 [Rhodothermaceae bacterium RA]